MEKYIFLPPYSKITTPVEPFYCFEILYSGLIDKLRNKVLVKSYTIKWARTCKHIHNPFPVTK